MNDKIWRRPLGQMMLLATVGLVWVLYSFLFMILIIVEFELVMVLALMPIPLIMLIPYFHTKRRLGEAWYSPSILVDEPSYEVIPRLERVLAEEEVSYTKRSETHDVGESPSVPTWDEVYEKSDSELRLHIYASHGRTTVYVGPLRKDNQDDVERLKGLVDRAMWEEKEE